MASITTRRLQEADREISDHFTAAVGAKAQRYEPVVTGGESSPEEGIMAPWRRHERARFRMMESLVAELPTEARRVLRLVYAYGTDALSDDTDEHGRPMAGKPQGLVTGRYGAQDPLGMLRVALSPSWGRGSYLRLAVGQDRALRAFAKRYPGVSPEHHRVLDFLAFEAGKGDASAGMLAELRRECEATRNEALEAFIRVQAARVQAARQARDESERAEAAGAEREREAIRQARLQGRLPACLRDMQGEKRDRLHEGALALLAQLDEELS